MSLLYDWYTVLELQNPTKHRFLSYELELGHGQHDGLVIWRWYWPFADSLSNLARVVGWGWIKRPFLVLDRWHLIEDEEEIRAERIARHLESFPLWTETEYVIKHYDLGGPVIWDTKTENPITDPDQRQRLLEACRKTQPPPAIMTVPPMLFIPDKKQKISAKADSRKTSAPLRFVYIEASPFYEPILGKQGS